MLPQTVELFPRQAEQPARKASKNPMKSSKRESRAVFLGVDVTSSASQQTRLANRPGQFVASQLSNRKVEVSVKNLSQEELQQLNKTRYEVMEALNGNPENKVNRLVLLAYQAGDLEDELLEVATPTPTRRAKHYFLAHHSFELKKADVSGAFLQGRVQQADRYAVPVNKIADELGIT